MIGEKAIDLVFQLVAQSDEREKLKSIGKEEKHCGEEIWCKDQHEFKSMLNTRMIEKILPISSGRRHNENSFDSNSSVLE